MTDAGLNLSRKGDVSGTAQSRARASVATRLPSQITIGRRYRTDYGDIDGLAREIDNPDIGLLQPIVISGDDRLIDGERRIIAWQRSGKRGHPIPVYVVNIPSILRGAWSANAFHKPFTPSEAVAIKRALSPTLCAEARERQRIHAGTARGRSGSFDPSSGRASDKVAAFTGMSRRTLEKAEKVVAAAECDARDFSALKDDMDRTGNVDAAYRKLNSTGLPLKRLVVFLPPETMVRLESIAQASGEGLAVVARALLTEAIDSRQMVAP